jgi:glycosyltransferase involved in cell wall biosynthesis
MKKVLIISLAYFPHVGGAEVAVKEITDRLHEIEFHMVTMRFTHGEPAEEKIGNVYVHRITCGSGLLGKFAFQFVAYRKAVSLHARSHFDAIWALMAHSAGVPAALFKMHYPDVGYVLNLQEGDPPEKIERTMMPLWPLFTRAFTLADIVQPLSNFLAAWARRRGFTGPIEVIPNGADIQRFQGDSVAHEGTVLITTSRLVHKNAVDDVIRALPRLPGVRFKVLGTGMDEQILKALAQKEGVAERVDFLGHVDHQNMLVHLHAADIFIRPSRSEGQGASFMEAMAAGLPVIATQEGGIADFLFDAKRNPEKPTTGWAVDKDSPDQIVAAVQDILENPEKTTRVVETAKKMVSEKYDWDAIAREMREKVFARLFAKS